MKAIKNKRSQDSISDNQQVSATPLGTLMRWLLQQRGIGCLVRFLEVFWVHISHLLSASMVNIPIMSTTIFLNIRPVFQFVFYPCRHTNGRRYLCWSRNYKFRYYHQQSMLILGIRLRFFDLALNEANFDSISIEILCFL